jgi:hypothetical protein
MYSFRSLAEVKNDEQFIEQEADLIKQNGN